MLRIVWLLLRSGVPSVENRPVVPTAFAMTMRGKLIGILVAEVSWASCTRHELVYWVFRK